MPANSPAEKALDEINKSIIKLASDHPDLNKSTKAGILSKGFEGLDVLQTRLKEQQNASLNAAVGGLTGGGSADQAALKEAMIKIAKIHKMAQGGGVSVMGNIQDPMADMVSAQVYTMMDTLLKKYAELKSAYTEAKGPDRNFEERLSRVDMDDDAGKKNYRLALGLAEIIKSVHKTLTQDPSYLKFMGMENAGNFKMILDIVSGVKVKAVDIAALKAPPLPTEETFKAPEVQAPPLEKPAVKGVMPPPLPAIKGRMPPPLPNQVPNVQAAPTPPLGVDRGSIPPPLPTKGAVPPPIPTAIKGAVPPPLPTATTTKGAVPPPLPTAPTAAKGQLPPPVPQGFFNKAKESTPPPLPNTESPKFKK